MATPNVDTRKLLSEAKFYDGYSRFNDELERYETWDEAVDRVIGMHEGYYAEQNDGDNGLQMYIDEARQAYKEQRVLGAQRALQFGGDQILKHQMRMYNCTSTYADRAEFFGEIFYMLLCVLVLVSLYRHIILKNSLKLHCVQNNLRVIS